MAVELLRQGKGLERFSLLKQWPNEVAHSFAGNAIAGAYRLGKKQVVCHYVLYEPPQHNVVVVVASRRAVAAKSS